MVGVKRMKKIIKDNVLPPIYMSNILAYCYHNNIRHNDIAKDIRNNIDNM